ncbi:MAG TPA: DUF2213 domain-containing protein, partial [Labilithrix sp.]|nr:DUF2213 domain-containing protein [Labilithrix sp.]
WNGVKEGIVRAVSVGFEPGQASKNDGVTTRTASELLEVSFVPVPKDEDAGILSPEERARRASAAASELARHRAKRTDAADLRVDNIGHFDAAQMSKVEWTPWGTARIKARVSRVGVLDYPGRRELRPRDEVMRADSIASLKGVPVVDFVDHKDLVGPDDFRKKVRGFVEEAHADGDYIAATLHIHDGPTLDAIRNGERLDISAGYIAPVDANPGEWQGERYDVVQRDIVYNHVALCPPGRGRAGREVALKLDSQTSSHRQVATVMADQVRRVAR